MTTPNSTNTVLMVRPANFGFNPETANDNFYQKQDDSKTWGDIQDIATREFDDFVKLLEEKGVNVVVVHDTNEPAKTDAVFPNNWFSTHEDGTLVLYPMASPNRRFERRSDITDVFQNHGFYVKQTIDLTEFECNSQFLEGTGSLVLDRPNRIVFAGLSVRTHMDPITELNKYLNYDLCIFHASQEIKGSHVPIYHTNVMMHVGTDLAIVCLESINDSAEKHNLKTLLEKAGKHIIPITPEQKFAFAGNMLEVRNQSGEKFTVMSETARDSLTPDQKNTISKYTSIIAPSIPLIEKLGGGSARCMMAEIFLPMKQ